MRTRAGSSLASPLKPLPSPPLPSLPTALPFPPRLPRAGHDTNQLMRKGIENRRVAHTKMNRESSRSHSVLTLTIESKTKNYSGMTVSKFLPPQSH